MAFESVHTAELCVVWHCGTTAQCSSREHRPALGVITFPRLTNAHSYETQQQQHSSTTRPRSQIFFRFSDGWHNFRL